MKIFKYATGDSVPSSAIYLGTITQTEEKDPQDPERWRKCWYVWHYFRVNEKEPHLEPRGEDMVV